jgi:hypothetical protein
MVAETAIRFRGEMTFTARRISRRGFEKMPSPVNFSVQWVESQSGMAGCPSGPQASEKKRDPLKYRSETMEIGRDFHSDGGEKPSGAEGYHRRFSHT